MPAIGTGSDIDYQTVNRRLSGIGRVIYQVKVTFPNNATNNTYPLGGVPLEKAKLGFPRGVASISVLGRTTQAGATNVTWEWNGDGSSPKLLGYEINAAGAADEQGVELDAADTLATNGAVLFLDVEGG
jgi:hypothetical protein